jgi:hypothetical protein
MTILTFAFAFVFKDPVHVRRSSECKTAIHGIDISVLESRAERAIVVRVVVHGADTMKQV